MRAFYDLGHSPPTYDFFGFLVSADNYRKRRGSDSLEIVLAPGPDHGFRGDNLPPRDPSVRRAMLENIVIRGSYLCPSVMNVIDCKTRDEAYSLLDGDRFPEGWTYEGAYYGTNRMVQAMNDPEFTGLRANKKTTVPDRSISITLRESHYWPTRNSNLQEWLKVAQWLDDLGWNPIIVRDTEQSGSLGFTTIENIDIQDRMALYEACELNLFVNNGPACLAVLNKTVNYRIFKLCAPDAPCVNEGFFRSNGLEPGGNWPHAHADQVLVWKEDTFENIREALCLI